MTDFNTRVKIMIGDLMMQNAQLSAQFEEQAAKIAALEKKPQNSEPDAPLPSVE